jgi:hypothetical protein
LSAFKLRIHACIKISQIKKQIRALILVWWRSDAALLDAADQFACNYTLKYALRSGRQTLIIYHHPSAAGGTKNSHFAH